MRWVGWNVSNPLKEEAQSRMNVLQQYQDVWGKEKDSGWKDGMREVGTYGRGCRRSTIKDECATGK